MIPSRPNLSKFDQARIALRDGQPAVADRMGDLTDFKANLAATRQFRKDTGDIIGDVWHWLLTPSVAPQPGNLQQLREATYTAVKKAHATMEWWYWTLAHVLLGHPLVSFIAGGLGGLMLLTYCCEHWNSLGRSFDLVSPYYWYQQYELHQLYHRLGYK